MQKLTQLRCVGRDSPCLPWAASNIQQRKQKMNIVRSSEFIISIMTDKQGNNLAAAIHCAEKLWTEMATVCVSVFVNLSCVWNVHAQNDI